ncbi:hypothetical protein HKD37_15G043855 [Glycine soja]
MVQFHLGVLDHDLAMLEEKFVTIIYASSNEEKVHYKAWKRYNRLSLMLMRMIVANNIKTTLPKIEMGECSQTTDKSAAGTLMSTLATMKFDGSRTMYEHRFLTIQTISPNEKFIFIGNEVKAPVETVETYCLKLNTGHR